MQERLRITSAGNVGIGTDTPDARFSAVASSANSTIARIGGLEYSGNQRGLTIKTFQSNGGDDCGVEFNAAEGLSGYGSFIFKADTSERMRINSSGNIGIGTTSPTSDAIVRFIEIEDSTSAGIVLDAPRVFSIFSSSSSTLVFRDETAGATRMTLDSSGNLGIGTTNPTGLLHVYGDTNSNGGELYLQINNNNTTDNIGTISFGNNVGVALSRIQAQTSGANNNSNLAFFTSTGATRTQKMVITNDGKVGINDTSPFTNLSISDATSTTGFGSNDSYRLSLRNTDTTNNNYALISFNDGDAGAGAMGLQFIDHTNNYGDLTFITRGADGFVERQRILSDGDIIIGGTAFQAQGALSVSPNHDTGASVVLFNRANSGTSSQVLRFQDDGSTKGSVSYDNVSTSFNTSSDYRLKEDLKDFNALDIASTIKMYDFKWKEADSRSYGVMAHELQEVLPQAVSGDKDAEEMQQVDYSKLVPILLKSIQELEARVQELEKEI